MRWGVTGTEQHDVGTGEGFEGWGAAVERSFPPLRLALPRAGAFRGRIRSAGHDRFRVWDISASPHLVERSRNQVSDSLGQYFKLSFQLSGTGLVRQNGRELLLRPGDITLYDTSRPYSILFEEDFRFVVAMFPRDALQFRLRDVEALSAVRLAGTQGVGALLSGFLRGLPTGLAGLPPAAVSRVSHAALELTASLIDAHLGEEESSREVLRRRIHAHVEENLHDPALSPASIAAAHYLSLRSLHALFEDEDFTVAAWIRHRRLEHCREDLCDPALAHLPVSEVASRWGMPDAAQFSKAFRRAYGTTPTAWRAAATSRSTTSAPPPRDKTAPAPAPSMG
ncbi:AraC-like ligand-binding domain-containing protein [Kineococcus sp. SYSU DK018]|uniref:AraC-like ligand-binding domain-containing protein n=1 Tax=Kineococcus sp. SYSU DK018 TaxID=3383139 RepID=UPI003D7F057B